MMQRTPNDIESSESIPNGNTVNERPRDALGRFVGRRVQNVPTNTNVVQTPNGIMDRYDRMRNSTVKIEISTPIEVSNEVDVIDDDSLESELSHDIDGSEISEEEMNEVNAGRRMPRLTMI